MDAENLWEKNYMKLDEWMETDVTNLPSGGCTQSGNLPQVNESRCQRTKNSSFWYPVSQDLFPIQPARPKPASENYGRGLRDLR